MDPSTIYNAEPPGVVVSGASGYVGGAIVKFLLDHTSVPRVHATVRGDIHSPRYEALQALDPSKQRLRIFSAELTEPGAFDDACRGCSAFIHVAAPTTIRCRHAAEAYGTMIEPAVKGIENVVSSVEKMGLKTLVFTSSMAAVQGDGWERGPGHVYTWRDWNEMDQTPKNNAYACMKVHTERRCWELYEGRKEGSSWERLVVLCPGFVLGAPSTDVRSELVDFAVLLMKGKIWPVIPNYHFSMVHLDDVAKAHVLAVMNEFVSRRTNESDVSKKNIAERYILAAGDETLGMKDVVCGRLKEGVRARLEGSIQHEQMSSKKKRSVTHTSVFRWPIGQAPRWILWMLSRCMDSVQWPLVRAYLNKPSSFDGGRVLRDMEGFGPYRDPVDGFVDLLEWIVARGLA